MAPTPSNLKNTHVVANNCPSAEPNELVLKNRLTALVVDDSAMNRRIHRTYLKPYGVQIFEASNGLEAVKLCEFGMIFNLILMDNDMPIMDGPAATKAIRALDVRSYIAGVTAKTEEKEMRDFIDAGLDEFVEKPLNRAKVIHLLRAVDLKITNSN